VCVPITKATHTNPPTIYTGASSAFTLILSSITKHIHIISKTAYLYSHILLLYTNTKKCVFIFTYFFFLHEHIPRSRVTITVHHSGHRLHFRSGGTRKCSPSTSQFNQRQSKIFLHVINIIPVIYVCNTILAFLMN